jgi:hypothetical protein
MFRMMAPFQPSPPQGEFLLWELSGPEGIRTPDLLNALQRVDRPPESTKSRFRVQT